MKSLYAQHSHWTWDIPISAGRYDHIDLTLGLLGRETLTLNGGVISHRHVFKLRNEYRVPLTSGRDAMISVRADWSKLGVPVCELRVDGELHQHSLGPIIQTSTAEPMRIPRFTKPMRFAVGSLEVYRNAFFIALLVVLGKALIYSEARARLPLTVFAGLCVATITLTLRSRRLAFLKARSEKSSFLEMIYREDFQRSEFKRAELQTRKARLTGQGKAILWVLFSIFGWIAIGRGWFDNTQIISFAPPQRQVFKVLVWLFVLLAPIKGLNAYLYGSGANLNDMEKSE